MPPSRAVHEKADVAPIHARGEKSGKIGDDKEEGSLAACLIKHGGIARVFRAAVDAPQHPIGVSLAEDNASVHLDVQSDGLAGEIDVARLVGIVQRRKPDSEMAVGWIARIGRNLGPIVGIGLQGDLPVPEPKIVAICLLVPGSVLVSSVPLA